MYLVVVEMFSICSNVLYLFSISFPGLYSFDFSGGHILLILTSRSWNGSITLVVKYA